MQYKCFYTVLFSLIAVTEHRRHRSLNIDLDLVTLRRNWEEIKKLNIRYHFYFLRRMNFNHEPLYNPKIPPGVCLAYVSSLQNVLVNIIL